MAQCSHAKRVNEQILGILGFVFMLQYMHSSLPNRENSTCPENEIEHTNRTSKHQASINQHSFSWNRVKQQEIVQNNNDHQT
jgi:hypothetical protein